MHIPSSDHSAVSPNWPASITAKTAVCMILGDPVEHSLTPAMHNAGYRESDLPFVMVAAKVSSENLEAALLGVRALGVRGLSLTMPHKVAALEFLTNGGGEVDPIAREIGAINTVVNRDGILFGYNTDWLGIREPLARFGDLSNRQVAVLGAGGAAQAVAFAAHQLGALVTVYNRSPERAEKTMSRWARAVQPLQEATNLAAFDVIINATSVGMGSLAGISPIPHDALQSHHIVFETIYSPRQTALLQSAARVGARTIEGLEMFLEQGLAQFAYHTGAKPPRDVMKAVLSQ